MSKSVNTVRKTPSQGRSRDLVDAIFQATVRILPKVGSAAITTKKIAEQAGVSVGSIYQYFPNKEAVLAAVMDASAGKINAFLAQRFQHISDMEKDEAIQYLVDTSIEAFLSDRAGIRETFRLVNELDRVQAILSFRRVAVEQFSVELHRRYPALPMEECRRLNFVAVNSLMGVVFTMLYDETQTWTKEELAAELGMMIRHYVREKTREKHGP